MLDILKIKSRSKGKTAELSNAMYDRMLSVRKKYNTPQDIKEDEAKLDALSYVIALANISNEAGNKEKTQMMIPVIAQAILGDFSYLKAWLEYHARPDPLNKIQAEINLANLL